MFVNRHSSAVIELMVSDVTVVDGLQMAVRTAVLTSRWMGACIAPLAELL